MRICTFCGSDSFDELDGFYYCSDCNRQSQESQSVLKESHVGLEAHHGGGGDLEGETHDKEEQGSGGPRKVQYFADAGVPWVSTEALAFVLKYDIECLIHNGAHASLRNIGYRLWALYVQKLGLAFVEDPFDLKLPYFKLIPLERDVIPPTIDNPWVLQNVLSWPRSSGMEVLHRFRVETLENTNDNTEPSSSSSSSSGKPKIKEEATLRKVRVSKQGVPLMRYHKVTLSQKTQEEIEHEGIEIGTIITGQRNKTAADLQRAKRKYATVRWHTFQSTYAQTPQTKQPAVVLDSRSPFRWQPNKILCLLYLSMAISGHYVTPGLIIRWANIGVILFRNMKAALPRELVITCQTDARLFVGTMPSLLPFTYQIRYLADFLGLDVLPLPPFQLTVARCIETLALPKDFYKFVVSFIAKVPVVKKDIRGKNYSFVVEYDSIALAYVLVCLKVVLQIDDSELQRKLQPLIEKLKELLSPLEVFLFDYSDWLTSIEHFVGISKKVHEEELLGLFSEKDIFATTSNKPREDLLQNRMPIFDKSKAHLQVYLEEMENKMSQCLRPNQRIKNPREKLGYNAAKDNLSAFRDSSVAHFGVSTFAELMEVFQIDQSNSQYRHLVADGVDKQVDEIFVEVRELFANATKCTTPFRLHRPLASLINDFPIYHRILVSACDAVLPTVALPPKNVHKIVCILEAYATGMPSAYFSSKFPCFGEKHFVPKRKK